MFDWIHKMLPKKHFYVLLEMTLHLEKKHNIYTRVLDFTFPKKFDSLDGGWKGRKGGCNKKG